MRNGAEDVENQFARGRCGVDSFFEADQVNAADLEAFDGIEQFFEGAAEAIETGNAEAVAGPGMVDQFRQGRTLEPSARDHVDEHANGAGLPQPILLAGGILCRSRDPGITEDVTVAYRAVRLFNEPDCVKSPSRGSLIRQHRRASTMTDPWRRRSLGAASLFGGVRCCCDWETRDGGGLLRQKRADYPVKPLRRQSRREFLRGVTIVTVQNPTLRAAGPEAIRQCPT